MGIKNHHHTGGSMKNILQVCILIYFIICSNTLYSQTDIWEQTGGPVNGNIQRLIVTSNDHLFAVNRDSGIFRSTNNGTTWTAVNSGITNLDIRALVVNVDGSIYAGGDGVFRSTNNGSLWISVKTGLQYYVYDLAVNSSGHLFAASGGSVGSGGVYQSTNSGVNWTNIGLKDTNVWRIAVTSSGHLFAGASFGGPAWGIFRSTNNGTDWVAVNNGLVANCIVNTIVSRPNGDLYTIVDCNGELYRSTNNGDNWDLIKHEGVSAVLRSLAFNSNGHIFGGSGGNRVIRSTDNGSNWTTFGTMQKTIPSMAVNSAGILFAGTYADGVFRTVQTTLGVKQIELQSQFALELKQNYPNPFNPATTIEYNLSKSSFVKLVIFNMLGQEVQTLVHGVKLSGGHKVEFYANNLPSGVYLCQIQSNGFTRAKTLLLLK